jgi:Cu2+-exporting ATPase
MNIMLFTLPSYFGMEKTFQYAGLFGLLSLGFATLSFMVGGSYFVGRAWQATRMGVMHIDMPIAIGILGAYLGSLYGWFTGQDRFVYFDFVGTFILLMLVGRWAQVSAVERNRRRLLGQQARPHKGRVICGAGLHCPRGAA